MEDETKVADTTTSDETVELDETTNDEEVVTLSKEEHEELLKKSEQFPNVVARAKKAEEEAKALKADSTKATPEITNSSLSEENVDVKILQSQGTDDESIEYLKKLAKVNETSLLAAQQDDLYISFKANKEAKEAKEKASLGASRGSGQTKKGKTITTPGLSDTDHKELWRKKKES